MFHIKYVREFDAFGKNHEDDEEDEEDQKDRRIMTVIWACLLLLFGSLFISAIIQNLNELQLKHNANSITTTYMPASETVVLEADDGKRYIIDLSDSVAAYNGNEITLYYYGDDLSHAKPLTWAGYWIPIDICWGSLSLICLLRFVKNIVMYVHDKDIEKEKELIFSYKQIL